jgi:hypothetical protein
MFASFEQRLREWNISIRCIDRFFGKFATRGRVREKGEKGKKWYRTGSMFNVGSRRRKAMFFEK